MSQELLVELTQRPLKAMVYESFWVLRTHFVDLNALLLGHIGERTQILHKQLPVLNFVVGSKNSKKLSK